MNGLLLQDGDAVEEISFEALFSSKLKKPKAGGGSKKLPVPADAGKQGRRFSQEKKAQHKDGAVKQKRKLPAIDASDRDDGEGDPAALGGLDGASGSHARDGSSGAKRPRLNAEQGRGPAPGGGGGGGKIKLTWPYPVDYLDHFETSAAALADLLPGLDQLATRLGRTRATLRIYDPYYCAGTIIDHWAALGFAAVLHEKKDCYVEWAAGRTPEYDVLVTNPPYSGDHKERCLAMAAASGKPWALLLPGYVAVKQYYAEAMSQCAAAAPGGGGGSGGHRHHHQQQQQQRQQQPSGSGSGEPFYLVPSASYTFEHPEGTGHDTCPFVGIWFCHFGRHHADVLRHWSKGLQANGGGGSGGRGGDGGAAVGGSRGRIALATSVAKLQALGGAPEGRRPNPRQRRKAKRELMEKAASGTAGHRPPLRQSPHTGQQHSHRSQGRGGHSTSGGRGSGNGGAGGGGHFAGGRGQGRGRHAGPHAGRRFILISAVQQWEPTTVSHRNVRK